MFFRDRQLSQFFFHRLWNRVLEKSEECPSRKGRKHFFSQFEMKVIKVLPSQLLSNFLRKKRQVMSWHSHIFFHYFAHAYLFLSSSLPLFLSHTHSLSLTHTLSLSLSHTHILSLPHIHIHTHTLSLSLRHTHTLTHIRSHPHTLSLTHTLVLTHTLLHSLLHSHIHFYTLFYTHTHTYTLFLSHKTHTHSHPHLTLTLSHTHIHSYAHTRTHTHTHAHTHTHTHNRSKKQPSRHYFHILSESYVFIVALFHSLQARCHNRFYNMPSLILTVLVLHGLGYLWFWLCESTTNVCISNWSKVAHKMAMKLIRCQFHQRSTGSFCACISRKL